MADPAQVANDMIAHAKYWHDRNRLIAAACRDAASAIHSLLKGGRLDGRTWHGLHRRLLNLEGGPCRNYQGYPNFTRARLTLEALRRGDGQ